MDPAPLRPLEDLREVQQDLAKKYDLHRTEIEENWRSLNSGQRCEILLSSESNRNVLKHPRDAALGQTWKHTPEINIREMCLSGPEFLLQHLQFRVTTSFYTQYWEGVNGGPGDREFVVNSIKANNLRAIIPPSYDIVVFRNDERYGDLVTVADVECYRGMIDLGLQRHLDNGDCTSGTTGHLILTRQLWLLERLDILVDRILGCGTIGPSEKAPWKKSEKSTQSALSKLSIIQKQKCLSMQELLLIVQDQKDAQNDYLSLCCTEPTLLSYAIRLWFDSNPQQINDERGRCLNVFGNKYFSIAFFELLHHSVSTSAIWDYLYRLLQLLADEPSDKFSQSIILQEIASVSNLEYSRAQKTFKRYFQSNTGIKYFKRISGVYDDGVARVNSKVKPEVLLGSNPQHHHMLRLCLAETNPTKAVAWIKSLEDLHKSHPSEQEKILEIELEAFGELAVVVDFIQTTAASLPLPPTNPNKGQVFISRLKGLTCEIDSLKTKIDLSGFLVPIHHIERPGMAEGALSALDVFITEQTGTTLGFLYQDLIEECISRIRNACHQYREKIGEASKSKAQSAIPNSSKETSNSEVRVQQRREKHKTRPAHSSIYSITSKPTIPTQCEASKTQLPFKVKKETFDTFSKLFSRSEARGSISWTEFESALANLSFSVMPKFGSIYTFFPPEDMGVQNSVTLHRPHKSQIQGHKLLDFAGRLRRVYGWGENSFVVG